MDTKELLHLGARALIVNLCKQLEDVVSIAPDLRRFAYSLARESVGMKPAGRKTKVNGTTAERLATQLIEARAKRSKNGRPPMSEAQRALMSRITKKRWAAAKKLGVKGSRLPSNAAIGKTPKPTTAAANGGGAAAE